VRSSTPRVLYVAPVEPWCRENGSSVVISDLLEGLAEADGPEMLPVFLRRPPFEGQASPPARLNGTTLGVVGLPRWLSIAGALASGRSPLRMRFANGRVARGVIRAVRERRFTPTVVHVEHLPVVDIGIRLAREFGCPLVYRAHNIESQLWARRLVSGGPLRRWLLRRMERLEIDAIAACQLTLCISDVDLAWVRASAASANADVLPCPLLLSRFERIRDETPVADRQIGFVGGLDWGPNESGLRWFVDHVLPLIRRAVPDVTLALLARGAETRPWLTRNPVVQLLPQTAAAPPLFAASRASIAPLLQGGGIRVKILESLAVGCPVVATRIGAEGVEVAGVTRTDDPAAFAEACVRHLGETPNREARRALSNNLRAAHGADVLAKKLGDFWTAVHASHHVDIDPARGA